MADDLNMLGDSLRAVLGDKVVSLEYELGELTLVVDAADIRGVLVLLRDDAKFRFEQLIDLCGMDYSAYGGALPGSLQDSLQDSTIREPEERPHLVGVEPA